MSYTGTKANPLERSSGSQVGQRMFTIGNRARGAIKSHRAQTEGVPYYRREYTHPITTQIKQVGTDKGTMLSRTNSSCINVNRTLPVTESARIQHQGQVQPRRTLMAHGKGSTGNLSDVPDMEEMAASPEKVPATASLITTSRGITGDKGMNESQSLQLKQGGSGGIGGVG